MLVKASSVIVFIVVVLCQHTFAQQNKVVMTAYDTTVFDVQSDSVEYEILSQLYKETNGKRWKTKTNWLKGNTSEEMARWHGVVVRDGDVSEIHLESNKLRGQIPDILYKLVRLRAVSFGGNNLEDEKVAGTSSGDLMNIMMESETVTESGAPQPVVDGKNLPFWGLAVKGNNVIGIDWRTSPPEIAPLPNSAASELGAGGVAIDECGQLAFYVLHSGTDKAYQLHLYDKTGTKLTTDNFTPNQALNGVHGNMELQVVRVPGKIDEWFIIYSKFEKQCLSNPKGSIYCPAKVVYTRLRYNASGLYIFPGKREVSISNNTFVQGKAVSRTFNGQTSGHYLYLAERQMNVDQTRVHRYIITENGITFDKKSTDAIDMKFWLGGIAGSSLELSPDEKTLAISNRNVGEHIVEDIILVDVNQFQTSGYRPRVISIPDLKMAGTNMTVHKFYSLNPQYQCLENLKNKLSFIEFSPSGRFLYAVHGGYPPNTGGVTYNSYLLQIDLQSSAGTDFTMRIQVQQGLGVEEGPSCEGSRVNMTNNFTEMIQSAYDGKLYFTKRNSFTLFAIPHPDDPIPHDLTPGVIDLEPSSNIVLPNEVKVVFMPENIDGYNYITRTVDAAFSVNKPAITVGETVTVTLQSPASYRYQISWGNGGVTQVGDGIVVPAAVHVSPIYTTEGDFTITLTVLDNENCASVSSRVVKVNCKAIAPPPISIIQYLCATKLSVPKMGDCHATYRWNFGDTQTSSLRNPLHVFSEGQYTVTVEVNYDCGGCKGVVTSTREVTIEHGAGTFEEIQVTIPTYEKPEVINSGASTFSDAWPLDHNEPELENLNSFVAGSKGVWRNQGTFLYNTPRSFSEDIDIARDGTYTLQTFSWPFAHLEGIPKWIKTNTITRYNSSSYETENRDVLGINSAALYDYRGQLQSAHGMNMRNNEMAFTGFEDATKISEAEFFMSKPTGNFIFTTEQMPAYTQYDVVGALSHIAIVNVPLADVHDVVSADLVSTSIRSTFIGGIAVPVVTTNYLADVNILCKQGHPTRSDWTVLVFEKAPDEGLWFGYVRIKNQVSPVVRGTISKEKAHSGEASLRISSDQVFEQKLIRLDAGKAYHINAWVTVDNLIPASPELSGKLGIDVILRNKQGGEVSKTFILPQGKIIEGWQQVRGSFVCPEEDLTLNLSFKPGTTGKAWYDDIRLHPENGNMKTYVYNISDYRLQAILDEENFASFFYYDKEGNLYLTKKETEEGIKTVTENISYTVEQPTPE